MSATRHFRCTACGQCCYGLLPLTWKDAVANVALFPLCFVWSAVRHNSQDYARVAKLGFTLPLANRKELAVLIMPTAYLPKSFPCPALQDDNLCSIHRNKPARCKTMPFYPCRDERYQTELLTPRPGWACDTSPTTAPRARSAPTASAWRLHPLAISSVPCCSASLPGRCGISRTTPTS